MDSFSSELFNDHNLTIHASDVQLEPMGTGPSEELVLQADNGGHGEVHLANGASSALWRISRAPLAHLCHISDILVHPWDSSAASPGLRCISSPALW